VAKPRELFLKANGSAIEFPAGGMTNVQPLLLAVCTSPRFAVSCPDGVRVYRHPARQSRSAHALPNTAGIDRRVLRLPEPITKHPAAASVVLDHPDPGFTWRAPRPMAHRGYVPNLARKALPVAATR